MPTRRQYIEQIRRQIYNGPPADDATITENLVNQWLDQAIGIAAKTNYKENIALDGVDYINNSFYFKFTGMSFSSVGNFLWKLTLPHIPIGISKNEGIPVLELVDTNGQTTRPFVPLSENQRTIYQSVRPIPNKILYYYEGEFLYAISTLILSPYTANVIMVSGGNSADLDSTLNIPPDYIPIMTDYIQKQLILEHNQPVDATNDGLDAVRTT